MLLVDVIQRITPVFERVEGAANVRQAMAQPIHGSNIAFVVPMAVNPQANSRDHDIGQPLQEVLIEFGVVTGLRSVNDRTGERVLIEQAQLSEKARLQLHGWSPANHEPITLGNSSLVGFVENGLWWLDRYHTHTWYQGAN